MQLTSHVQGGLATLLASAAVASAAFDTKAQFAWVDSSCDILISAMNTAGDEYLAMTEAAYNALGNGRPVEISSEPLNLEERT